MYYQTRKLNRGGYWLIGGWKESRGWRRLCTNHLWARARTSPTSKANFCGKGYTSLQFDDAAEEQSYYGSVSEQNYGYLCTKKP